MKNRLYLISILVLCSIPFVASWEGASSVEGSPATEGMSVSAAIPNAASFMPVLDTDMSDLDVRDAQNRPVYNAAARQNLAALFIENLFDLAVVQNLPGVRQIWADIELFSRLFRNLIFNIFYPINTTLPEALARAQKRFVHNVHNLWITLSVALLLCSLLYATILARSCQQSIILRC